MEDEITGMWCDEVRNMPKDLVKNISKKMQHMEIITTNGNFDWEQFLAENERLRDGDKF